MNLAQLLADAAGNRPDAPALARGAAITASYAEHADRSARLGGSLLNDLGLAPGDRVAIAMKNAPEYSESMFGAWHAGLATVPMNARLHPREFAYILENSGARACFVSDDLDRSIVGAATGVQSLEHVIVTGSARYDELLSAAPAELAAVDGDALAWLFYTSGTTGNPKGALHGHRSLLGHMPAVEFFHDFLPQPGDLMWTPADWAWIGGLTGESLFMTHFRNAGRNKARVAFGAPYPGHIIAVDMAAIGEELICQKDAFLCAALGTQLSIAFTRRLGTGFFGGEGFILQRLRGDGMAFVHAGGTVIKRELRGQMLRVDTGCLVAFSPGISYDIEMTRGLKSMFFGGEGMFLATLQGTGTVYLQSLPFSRLADRILANAPAAGGKRTGEGSLLGGLGDLLNGDNR